MALRLLPKLKLTQLKTLTVACGLPSSGTKDAIVQRLESAVSDYRRRAEQPKKPLQGRPAKEERAKKQHILSIDLGIRNLALAFLTPSEHPQLTDHDFRIPKPIVLNSWKVVELRDQTGEKGLALSDETAKTNRTSTTGEAGETTEMAPEKDQWSPASMAGLTWNLVKNRVMTLDPLPTHILIERQRFRSGGAAAVQEWTLRVNTLEAMLHAVLRAHKEIGQWKGEVHSIAPGRVGPFWLTGADAAVDGTETDETNDKAKGSQSRKSAKVRNKKAKIDLVGNWLSGNNINPVGGAEHTAQAYLKRWSKKPRGASSAEDFTKLDDLADSLLQGMAWIKWEDNIKLLATGGPEAFIPSGDT
jgi:cruciform cutting endonuclease 1